MSGVDEVRMAWGCWQVMCDARKLSVLQGLWVVLEEKARAGVPLTSDLFTGAMVEAIGAQASPALRGKVLLMEATWAGRSAAAAV